MPIKTWYRVYEASELEEWLEKERDMATVKYVVDSLPDVALRDALNVVAQDLAIYELAFNCFSFSSIVY